MIKFRKLQLKKIFAWLMLIAFFSSSLYLLLQVDKINRSLEGWKEVEFVNLWVENNPNSDKYLFVYTLDDVKYIQHISPEFAMGIKNQINLNDSNRVLVEKIILKPFEQLLDKRCIYAAFSVVAVVLLVLMIIYISMEIYP